MKRTTGSIAYDLIDPTGNITILVTTPVEETDRARIATDLMKKERSCEQVGYVVGRSDEGIDIAMAAGEFCGNAVMSAASLYCDDTGMAPGTDRTVMVTCTGCDDTLQVYITRKTDQDPYHIYGGRVRMPLPAKISNHTFEYDGNSYTLPLAEFDGISHAIATAEELSLPDRSIEDAARKWCDELDADCFGIMVLEDTECTKDECNLTIRPVVYAPSVGTCYWESSCASGTTAVFVYLKGEKGVGRITANEPGGVLSVSADESGYPLLEGNVKI